MSAPNEPVPDMVNFTFIDQEENTYRSTKLLEYANIITVVTINTCL